MTYHIRNHFDNKIDKRYTITREYCGRDRIEYVARFCGEFIASSNTKKLTIELAQEYYDNHKIDGVK